MKSILLIILVLSITACASSRGFDRGSLRDQTSNQKSVTEEDIKKVLTLKPQLPNPFKLAVFFSSSNTVRYYKNDWTWVGEGKDKFLLINDSLGDKNIISDVILINDSIVEGKSNKAIRLAAARAGAVLIVNGISDIDKYNNSLGFTYILLITPFFIPGT